MGDYWKVWVLTLFFIASVLFIVMDFAPYLHIDEFTIVELGRIIFQPTTSWSIAWGVPRDLPAINIFYIGAIFQELSFQALGVLGPRLSGITGALVSATILFGWLIKRGTSRQAAYVLSIVFLLDPIFVQAHTMGRLDGWALAFVFLSCLSLREANVTLEGNRRYIGCFILAGFSAIFSVFIWPSAALLFPLILLELLVVTWGMNNNYNTRRITSIFLFSLGGILALIIVVLPLIPLLTNSSLHILEGIILNLYSAATKEDDAFSSRFLDSVLTMLRTLKFSPFLVVFSIIATVITRNIKLAIATLLVVGVLLFSLVYLHRVIYLLPYMILAISEMYPRSYEIKRITRTFSFRALGLGILIGWSLFVSLFGRTFLSWELRREDSRNLILSAAKNMIGIGNHSVYLPGPEFYYAGRELGWEMYRPYAAHGDTLSPTMLANIIPRVDYVVMPFWEEDEVFNKLFAKEGFIDKGWYHLYDEQEEVPAVESNNIARMRNLFFIHPKAYGPYKLYEKGTAVERKIQQ